MNNIDTDKVMFSQDLEDKNFKDNFESDSGFVEAIEEERTQEGKEKVDLKTSDTLPLNLKKKSVQSMKQKVISNAQALKFKVVLHVYCTKNNVSWVLSDITRSNIFYKRTGGNATKRGYLKNSQKVSLQKISLKL